MCFQGGIKFGHWLLTVVNIPFKINPSIENFSISYFLKAQENQRFSGGTKWEHRPEMG